MPKTEEAPAAATTAEVTPAAEATTVAVAPCKLGLKLSGFSWHGCLHVHCVVTTAEAHLCSCCM